MLKNETDDTIKAIGIAPDMTLEERIKNKKLRDELKAKRDNGETGWKISKGKLIQVEERPETAPGLQIFQ